MRIYHNVIFLIAAVGLFLIAGCGNDCCTDNDPVATGPIHVYPDGSGSWPNIQWAVNSAADGDTIYLADGAFQGDGNRDILISGKSITIRSVSGSPTDCVIDCADSSGLSSRAFVVGSVDESTCLALDAVTIQNGGSLVDGGAILLRNVSPKISKCKFTNNSARYGGAIFCDTASHAELIDCVFLENEAVEDGGAVYVSVAASQIEGCVYYYNTAGFRGGAVFCDETTESTEFERCTFQENSALFGGGVGCYANSPEFSTCYFNYNEATEPASGMGGGLYCLYAPVILSNCHFTGNSGRMGGGAYLQSSSPSDMLSTVFLGNEATGYGGGLVLWETSASFDHSGFYANSAESDGGGMYADAVDADSCFIQFTEVFCQGNSALSGGGLLLKDVDVEIDELICVSNSASINGGGVDCAGGVTGTFLNSTWAGNSAPIGSAINSGNQIMENCILAFGTGGENAVNMGSGSSISCCNIYGNEGGDWVGGVADHAGQQGNFSADPLFCDWQNGDVHLNELSPCVDASGCGRVGPWPIGCWD